MTFPPLQLSSFATKIVLAALSCFAAQHAVALPTSATESPVVDAQEHYLDALQAINEKRRLDAKETLRKLVAIEPQHAGALLDLAIIHCELGDKQEAERLFQLMITRFSPPPAILEIIERHRASGCTLPKPHSQFSVFLESGMDSNVNQGASNSSFNFGNAGSQINLQLLPEYLPKADHFTAFSVDYIQDVFSNGSSGFLQLKTRQYNRLSKFDTNIAAIGFESPWRVHNWAIRTTMMASILTLNQRLYQKQNVLQIRVTPPLNLPSGMQLNLLGSTTRALYPTLTNYDATTSEVRGMFTAQNAAFQLQASAGWLQDHGKDNRLGGNRSGWTTGVQTKTLLTNQLLGSPLFGELSWQKQLWQSSKIYSPGLINLARRQSTEVARAALKMPVNEHNVFQLELRRTFNRENISFYDYNSRSIQISWQWLQ